MDARIIAVYDYVVLRPEEQVVFLHNPSLLRRLCHAQLITRSTHDRSRLQYDDPVVFVDVVGMDRDEVTRHPDTHSRSFQWAMTLLYAR